MTKQKPKITKNSPEPNGRPITYLRQWQRKNPEKIAANQAVYRAIREGILIRPSTCQDCGNESDRIEAHHWSYDRRDWLIVEWLCRRCHKRADIRRQRYEREEIAA